MGIAYEPLYVDVNQKKDFTILIGSCGKWQIVTFVILLIGNIFAAWPTLGYFFFAYSEDTWCAPPAGSVQDKYVWRNQSIPYVLTATNERKYSKCEMYDANKTSTFPCKDWVYDNKYFESTIISEWDLVCDREWMASLSQTVYMAGFFTAVLFLGQLSDKYGRRPTTLFCISTLILSSFINTFSISPMMYIVTRYFMAIGASGIYTTCYVFLIEIVGPRHRTIIGTTIMFGWAIGYLTLPMLAWLTRNWSQLQLYISIASLYFLAYFWFIPESPRWLLARGNKDDAEKILKKAARTNGKNLDKFESEFSDFTEAQEMAQNSPDCKDANIFDLFKYPNLRRNTLNICFAWFVTAFMYYALSFNGLGGDDPFESFFYAALTEFPAYGFSAFILSKLGRKRPLMGALILAGASSLLCIPFNIYGWTTATKLISILGKFFITLSFGIIYVYTTEIFPTVARNVGLGTSSTCGRMGSMLAPWVKELGTATSPIVTMAIFGLLSVTSGVLVYFLPETHNQKIPDSIQDAELNIRSEASFEHQHKKERV